MSLKNETPCTLVCTHALEHDVCAHYHGMRLSTFVATKIKAACACMSHSPAKVCRGVL
jgi:hypothetical protein